MDTASCSSRVATLALAVGIGAATAVTPLHAASAASLYGHPQVIQYWGSPGETNSVTLKVVGADYVITDPGATSLEEFDPFEVCAASGSTITCPTAGVSLITLDGGDMNDTITVEASVPIRVDMRGGDGDDDLNAQGGIGHDLSGQQGVDTLLGGGGDDSLRGGEDGDILIAGAGNDTLYGDEGTDHLVAGEGNDMLDPGLGVLDDVVGGSGRDTVAYQRSAAVDVSLDDQPNDGEPSESDNVRSDVEVVNGGSGDDVLTGSAGKNTLNGFSGDDTLNGGGGNDRLNGHDGSDRLRGDGGDDFLDGGWLFQGGGPITVTRAGSRALLDGSAGADDFSGGPGSDHVPLIREFDVFVTMDNVANDGEAGEGDNVRADVESVITGDGDDVLVGTSSANEFSTGAGVDKLSGMGGSDGLVGGSGADVIKGGTGVDSLYGEAGADSLNSKDTSRDYVSCGGSVDTVTRNSGDQVTVDCERVR